MTNAVLKIRLQDSHKSALLGRGVNPLAFSVKPFALKPATFTSHVPGLKAKMVEADTQLNWFQQMLSDLDSPWCFCISSEPNDRMAKAAAAFLMQNYLIKRPNSNPMWHDLMGGFNNPLVDPTGSNPKFIVINNVLSTSTPVKLEKLRDILEYRASVPRVIITSGTDPFSFFNTYIKYPLTGCLYLKTSVVRGDLEV